MDTPRRFAQARWVSRRRIRARTPPGEGSPWPLVAFGWLIFGLPPAELAVHPTERDEGHELYLMTDDVKALVADLTRRGVATSRVASIASGPLQPRAGGA
jgi:hypothetical protein